MTFLERYEQIVGCQEVNRLKRMAERLAGKRIVHVNSTRAGGGVAEILGWMVPLMNELGLDARWEVITGSPEFYKVTKSFHNGLQGLPVTLKKGDFDLHSELNRDNAVRLDLNADVVFIHDPQPIFLPRFTRAGPGKAAGYGAATLMRHDPIGPSGSTWKAPSLTTRRRFFPWRLLPVRQPARCTLFRLRSTPVPTRTASCRRRSEWKSYAPRY